MTLAQSEAVRAALIEALRRSGVADVEASPLAVALYSSDASVYRVPPVAVARPRHRDELDAIVSVVGDLGLPLTMRGAGTSIAGNAIGPGLVVDTSRHLNRVLGVDPAARTAVVEPGTVHATLQRQAVAHGLRFGPDPSTHSRCTVGGMVGNNACGSRALGYGRTSDNVVALDAITATGESVAAYRQPLAQLVDGHLAAVRTNFGRFGRQGSGYALEHLLPEQGRSLARFLVGSEGTLAVIREATVRLVEEPAARVLLVLGYPDLAHAADAVPGLLTHAPVACEGLDRRLIDLVPHAPRLPRGGGWLLVELVGSTVPEAKAAALRAGAESGALEQRVVVDASEQTALWRIREDGAGLASRATVPPGQAGWEDAAVPPARLGSYLRDFQRLLDESGLAGVPYGHFGDGCLHVRIDFALRTRLGLEQYSSFVREAARLVASYGGSLSGEHGDGRARSALLPLMFPPEALALFGQVKHLMDPRNLLNPGVLVDPVPLDENVRLAMLGERRVPARLILRDDDGDLAEAVHRCTGVGKCLADNTGSDGVMCPSYQATKDEKDSTRGRARVLQEVVAGRLSWGDEAVADALDLCLSCKGCANDCPTGVDVATYKAEALDRRYQGRVRPRSHYALGRLPWLLRRVPPGVVNAGLSLAPLAKAVAGVDARRSLPRVAGRPAHRSMSGGAADPDVVIWLDTFTDRFAPQVAQAAVRVLEAAGQRVRVVGARECCGLTWLSTGQLERAAELVTETLVSLGEYADQQVPVVVLEPSCLSVLRHDARLLVADADLVAAVSGAARSLSEHLAASQWTPPDLSGVEIVVQAHCHQASVVGWQADEQLLSASGAVLHRVGGCCGMAGNFGMERGHYEVSRQIYSHGLGAALAAHRDAVVLADGFSCRTQLTDLAGVASLHLAELWAGER